MTEYWEAMSRSHARSYHRCVRQASRNGFASDYRVWGWREMPKENRRLLVEASKLFLKDETGKLAQIRKMINDHQSADPIPTKEFDLIQEIKKVLD